MVQIEKACGLTSVVVWSTVVVVGTFEVSVVVVGTLEMTVLVFQYVVDCAKGFQISTRLKAR